MPAIILFCKSEKPEPYVNVLAYATTHGGFSIDSVSFVLYEMPPIITGAVSLNEAISKRLHGLRGYSAYQKAIQTLGRQPYTGPLDRCGLNAFVEQHNHGANYFDLTGLPKEDLVSVLSVLLANGVKNIRTFKSITMPAKLLHEYSSPDEYQWLNVYEIVDEFMGFFDRREGQRLLRALSLSFTMSATFSGWLWIASAIKAIEVPIYFFSISGSVFSIALPLIYWIARKRSLIDRLRRTGLVGAGPW